MRVLQRHLTLKQKDFLYLAFYLFILFLLAILAILAILTALAILTTLAILTALATHLASHLVLLAVSARRAATSY